MREEIYRGLLANDIVGFHTRSYRRNFLQCCRDLLDLEVDMERGVVHSATTARCGCARIRCRSTTRRRARSARATAGAASSRSEVLRRRREYSILRVDRADLSKNVLRGFTGFDIFLEQHPEFAERITFTAQLMPSRTDVPEYAEYLEQIEALVAVVNHRHGTPDWMPINLKLRDDLDEAVASYKHYDVMMVNAMFDGMNLVAKEGPLVNERDGVSILSENTGAHEELGEFALSVNPFDVQELADAIYAALTMAPEERERRCARACKEIVTSRDPGDWIDEQIADIAQEGARRGAGRRSGRRSRPLGAELGDDRVGIGRRGGAGVAVRAGVGGRAGAGSACGAARRVAAAARSPAPRARGSGRSGGLRSRGCGRCARRCVRARLHRRVRARRLPARLRPARAHGPAACAARAARGRAGVACGVGDAVASGTAVAAGARAARRRPGAARRRRARATATRRRRAARRCPIASAAPGRPSMPAIGAAGTPRRFAPALLACAAAWRPNRPIYDLTLLLDTGAGRRAPRQILANVEDVDRARRARSSAGTTGASAPTAYEVRKRTDADYHLLQFHGPRELLEQLDHNLKITDGVLRFRIIKLRPGTPAPPDLRAAAAAPRPPTSEPLEPVERSQPRARDLPRAARDRHLAAPLPRVSRAAPCNESVSNLRATPGGDDPDPTPRLGRHRAFEAS